MSELQALFPLVKDEIHFDVLMQQVHDAIDSYSAKVWSDTGAHDPGITLLEAFCFGVSDLSYRTSLPLVDLLTPPPSEQGAGLFPEAFGPQQVLTVGPITVDDYRRAILDLYSPDGTGFLGETGYFYFRNAQLIRESDEDRYTYWYDFASHAFTFSEPDAIGDSTPEKLVLLGNYTLYVEPTRDSWQNRSNAEAALAEFLRDNRNLCELIRKVVWKEPADVFPKITLELEDDVQDASAVLAAIFRTVDDYVNPPVRRYSAVELLARGMTAEEIYRGPLLRHGWIVDLPADRDYTQSVITVDLSGLASLLLQIDGVSSIRTLGVKNDAGNWIMTCPAGYFPFAWGKSPLYNLSSLDDVQLFKRGQRYRATEAEIKANLTPAAVIDEKPVALPFGEWRNPARYYPATDWIPPCYGLQDPEPGDQSSQLHRFLLPFEQQLADGCAQLALLPQLLNFERKGDTAIWGGQWPFAQGTVSDRVHQDYKPALIALLKAREQDPTQEMQLIDYLLGYFGATRAPRILSRPIGDFLTSQRGYLAELGDLGYHRANIRSDRVSALQKRIAARLGIGGELFNAAVDMGNLPFYLVENRSLLPPVPETPSSESFAIPKGEVVGDTLSVSSDVAHLVAGELIDLELDSSATAVLRTLTVRFVGPTYFHLHISENTILENNLDRVMSAMEAGTLQWRSSNVWMTTMVYQLAYADDQSGLKDDEKRLASTPLSPFPVRLQAGDTIVIDRGFGPVVESGAAREDDTVVATVISVDAIGGTYVVSSGSAFPSSDTASKYRWYQNENVTDRFSFTISLVFDRTMFDGVADPAMTEQWIRQVVLSEIPADVGVQFYWFSTEQFRSFAATYKRWLANDSAVGDYAYQLLFQLALGVRPQVELGVSLMKIASAEERLEVVGAQGDEWNVDAILAHTLFYVPVNSGSRYLKA